MITTSQLVNILIAMMIIIVTIISILVISNFTMQNQIENIRQKVYGSTIIVKMYQNKMDKDNFNHLLEEGRLLFPYHLRPYNVSCDSRSMFPTTTCRDTPIGRPVSQREQLDIGRMYTYDLNVSDDEPQVMHRLVACLDHLCNLTIFKGDNNYAAEVIPRSAVKDKIEMISFG